MSESLQAPDLPTGIPFNNYVSNRSPGRGNATILEQFAERVQELNGRRYFARRSTRCRTSEVSLRYALTARERAYSISGTPCDGAFAKAAPTPAHRQTPPELLAGQVFGEDAVVEYSSNAS